MIKFAVGSMSWKIAAIVAWGLTLFVALYTAIILCADVSNGESLQNHTQNVPIEFISVVDSSSDKLVDINPNGYIKIKEEITIDEATLAIQLLAEAFFNCQKELELEKIK